MPIRTAIHQIYYSAQTRALLDERFIPFDNSDNPRPDWREYFPIRRALLEGRLTDEECYYGFLSPKFQIKTGLSGKLVQTFIESAGGAPDVVAFSPLFDQQAFFLNTFEQGEHLHPGMLVAAETLVAQALPGVNLRTLVMDSSSSLFCNYFIAKPRFWRRWFQITELIFQAAENDQGAFGQLLRRAEAWDPIEVQLKVFLQERVVSLLVACERQWRCVVMDPFMMPGSVLEPFASAYKDAIVLEALKSAHLRYGFPEFLRRFNELRLPFFQDKLPPFAPGGAAVPAPKAPAPTGPLTIKDALAEQNPYAALALALQQLKVGKLAINELIEAASLMVAKNMLRDAIALYGEWLARIKSPFNYVIRFNLGVLVADSGDVAGAEAIYRDALQDNPEFPQARLNLATALERLKRPDEAIAELQDTVARLQKAANPDRTLLLHALNNLGRILEQEKRLPEAEAILERSLNVDAQQPKVIWHWIHLRQKQCKWPVYTPINGLSVEHLVEHSSALALLAGTGDPAVQLRAAQAYAREIVPTPLPALAPPGGYRHDRLRVGYLSSNFGMHAVSILTAEMYELHDRQRVEVYAYCWSPEDNSPLRARVLKAMDHVTLIGGMSDAEAAEKIRADEIDIVIDLQGLTAGCRPRILAYRPAPVQITYIGFPGTTGLPEVDYVICDRYVVPEDKQHFFSERPLYMPDCFQSNDRQRIPTPTPTRAACGLPETGFVFCAFNNNYKFTPEMFAVWMRILRQTPDSVLWLLADNPTARANLAAAAEAAGVATSRLVFAPRAGLQDYWARYALADLFLDTLPFNGGTTASDALWMEVPVLTCSGQTFASRMAGSLLQAVGLPDLITTDLAAYEALAVRIGNEPALAADIKRRLKIGRAEGALFDTPRFMRNLEDALERIAIRDVAPAAQ